MLDKQRNRTLTQVGRGTPMGELMRRYWHPIAAVTELENNPVKAIRLMGEDLVLYRDGGGTYGLLQRKCAHRGADLSYGFVEDCGLRCNYHGWLYDHTGRCAQQPYEERLDPAAKLRKSIRMQVYPVEANAGLVWAYLGPQPLPLVPTWEPFTWSNGFVQIVFAEIPCNWFQAQENSIDPVHFEWMHDNWGLRRLHLNETTYAPAHLKLDFAEFEYGFTYKRVREGSDESGPLWRIGRVCLWPNALFTGEHFEWRVPIDDENTLSVTWAFTRVPHESEPYRQSRIPYWHGPIRDPQTGRWISSHVMNQDFIAWVGQGSISDRTIEHLGASDRGISMIRRRFFKDLEAVERGEDPKAIVRDRETNVRIDLPIAERDLWVHGMTRKRFAQHNQERFRLFGAYTYQAGQPEAVKRQFEEAIGMTVEECITEQ
jgi:5,5'-dehydrodivanillate O-demethylase oxygenase subunit